jgi:group II intron reverse transcriptase/maturase
MDWMREAYRLTRKDGAPGIDGVTATTYEANLEANLRDLLERIKSGRYQAPPVRRAYIPKADGTQRPLGIPTFEDKVAQRAVTMVLEAVYEQDFLPCSYGFRPGRSAQQALRTLRDAIWGQRLYWVLDIDIRKYFDSIPHAHLRRFLDQRVTDGVIRRMIDKWLKAGVVEDGHLRHATAGSPQGGVISPCLSNIYLHYVLDEWFETEVRRRLKGRCILVRYADDLVMAFEHSNDAERVLAVLGKRLERYGLMLHPDKTRFVDFRPNRPDRTDHPATDGTSFDFLGFTHVWGKSRNGKNMVRQVTAKGRYARALAAVTERCRANRHQPIPTQHACLSAMMRGHYAYYGIAGNGRRLRWYARQVVRIWKKWLSRRGRHGNVPWSHLTEWLKRHPLPPPRIVHPYVAASEALA